jgi:sec-independent protein translocase protein TatB
MFGLAWTEIGLIGVVAMILIGPKDMPVAIRGVADMVKKARRMAREFQVHVDDMMRDSGMQEVRQSISELRGMDIRGEVMRAVDEDGSIRSALAEDPFRAASATIPGMEEGAIAGTQSGEVTITAIAAPVAAVDAPAFIPPDAAPIRPPPPPFIPPDAARPGV